MSSKQITLITTALSKFTGEKKNLIFLGEWCHADYKNNFNNLKQNQTMKHHWCEFNKRLKDVKYLKELKTQKNKDNTTKTSNIKETH